MSASKRRQFGSHPKDSSATSSSGSWTFTYVIISFIAVSFGVLWWIQNSPTLFSARYDLPEIAYELIEEYPHDPDAFTQGLIFEDGVLYESTGQFGESSIRVLDISKQVPKSIARTSADIFGEGLVKIGDELVQLTWKNELILVYDAKTLKEKRRVPWKGGEGWGLAYDGKRLVASNGTTYLLNVDPKTFEVTSRKEVTHTGRVGQLNELEFVEGKIFSNVWYSDTILQIDPDSGKVLAGLNLEKLRDKMPPLTREDVLNGIAYDSKTKTLYVTGKNWPKLFALRLKD